MTKNKEKLTIYHDLAVWFMVICHIIVFFLTQHVLVVTGDPLTETNPIMRWLWSTIGQFGFFLFHGYLMAIMVALYLYVKRYKYNKMIKCKKNYFAFNFVFFSLLIMNFMDMINNIIVVVVSL